MAVDLARCPRCERPVVREMCRRPYGWFSNVTQIVTPWWWCHPCGTRVEPVYLVEAS